jgi:hypothetical protein
MAETAALIMLGQLPNKIFDNLKIVRDLRMGRLNGIIGQQHTLILSKGEYGCSSLPSA